MHKKILTILFFALLVAPETVWLCGSVPCFAQYADTAWVRRYKGPGTSSGDETHAIAVDNSGYVYVTGYSIGSGNNGDYATIKYKPNGDTAWVRRYNGPANGNDYASAMTVDDSGNVYVTGTSDGSGTGSDYATVRYYPNGVTAWVKRYNGPGNDYDGAKAIAVDDSGYVYVTGVSSGTGTSSDYATIKYYPNGDTAWMRRYNGPGYTEDEASAIAVDNSGNVYVTGASIGSGTYQDYATIKYYPNGVTAWVNRYGGPENYEDYAKAIAIAGSGNVYVTGNSVGSGTADDYAMIRYKPNGDTAWVRRYNGPENQNDYACAIAVDGYRNVYVTGTSDGSGGYTEYATIKYVQYLTDTLTVIAFSPVDLIVIDPEGDSIGIGFNTILHADYDTTQDYNHDGDKDDIVTIPDRSVGDYLIEVIPELGGGGGVYSLGVRINGSNTVMLSTNHPCPSPGEVDTFYYHVPWYKPGDASGDWVVNSADVSYLINYLFVGGPAPQPRQAGDANCDGIINSADVAYLINYLFVNGPPPPEC
jgi:hypothetical protein